MNKRRKSLFCNRCGVALNDTNWPAWAKKRYEYLCKECQSKRVREYYHKNIVRHRRKASERAKKYRKERPGLGKNRNLKWQYNISLTEYNDLFSKQQGLCAICGKPEIAKTKRGVMNLAVDHCHKTKKNRGLLCMKCNTKLGWFEENKDKIMGYLL